MVEIVKIDEKLWKESINRAMPIFNNENVEMGILTLAPGERSPKEGFSIHPNSEEYAYVLEGEIIFCTDEKCYTLKEGDLMYNSKGTPHYTENKSEKIAKILWAVSPPL
ncbi:MAG: cupin domain-containing protein [Thermoplasmata archaeon]|nr:cupin domain-containing protein [Thermoplasmata archaeon]